MARTGPHGLAFAVGVATLLAGLVALPNASASTPEAPAVSPASTGSDTDGLAPTPPMGWNSWNQFHCDIDEDLIRETIDAMAASGMKEAGYEYVNIDDCWMAPERDAEGRLQPDPVRFPNGIKALADRAHSKGLKLGIYSSAGTHTCQGLPASLDHEEIDAQTFADWGIDYLKYDNCNNQGRPAIERYQKMGEALRATGRPIVYSICEWGTNDPWLWGNDVGGDLWRTTGDISDNWGSVMSILDQQVGIEQYSGPNGWNDPDMLEVGNGGMTATEYRAHFGLWSLVNSPLLAGNDLRTMSEETLSILTNREVIAVNQDFAGTQGYKLRDDGDQEVWGKPMSDGSYAVVLLNRASGSASVSVDVSELDLPSARAYAVRDLWAHETRTTTGRISTAVPSHGGAMYRIWPSRPGAHPPAAPLTAESQDYANAGETVSVETTLTNDGPTPVRWPRVSLTAPEGWEVVTEGETARPVLPPGASLTTAWQVSVPADAPGGKAALDVAASYVWRDPAQPFSATANADFYVVRPPGPGEHWLSDLDWIEASNGWGPVERDSSNGETSAGDGEPITIAGVTYEKGLGVHATSSVWFALGGGCPSFEAVVGVDDETNGNGSVEFEVYGDGELLASSGVITGGEAGHPMAVDTTDVRVLDLRVNDGGDNINYDHADWANARIQCDT